MQIASQLNLSAPANSDAERQLREFAHTLAKTHRVERASFIKSSLVEHLKSWEQALRNANAIFKGRNFNGLVSVPRKRMDAG